MHYTRERTQNLTRSQFIKRDESLSAGTLRNETRIHTSVDWVTRQYMGPSTYSMATGDCRDVLYVEMLWAIECVSAHYSCLDISDVLREMFPDSSIAHKFTCGDNKCAYLIPFGKIIDKL